MLLTRKQAYIQWMSKEYKMQRVQRTAMSYRMRLAAMQAVSTKHAISKQWS